VELCSKCTENGHKPVTSRKGYRISHAMASCLGLNRDVILPLNSTVWATVLGLTVVSGTTNGRDLPAV
jgi:hypothetical protein